MRRILLIPFVAFAAYAANAGDPAPMTPRRAAHIDVAHCLDVIERGAKRDDARCRAFLIDPLGQARRSCAEAGGKLVAARESNVWQIDVNGDGHEEYLFKLEENVTCEGVWSLFDCGSLGCPAALHERIRGAWRQIAEIYADSFESIELLRTTTGSRYRDLRVNCQGESRCAESWFYRWRAGQYERERLEVRGFGVSFSRSVHGLYSLISETELLATPGAGAAVIKRYPAGTEVQIVGTAENADFYYVSPCNACESGFVPISAVAKVAQ